MLNHVKTIYAETGQFENGLAQQVPSWVPNFSVGVNSSGQTFHSLGNSEPIYHNYNTTIPGINWSEVNAVQYASVGGMPTTGLYGEPYASNGYQGGFPQGSAWNGKNSVLTDALENSLNDNQLIGVDDFKKKSVVLATRPMTEWEKGSLIQGGSPDLLGGIGGAGLVLGITKVPKAWLGLKVGLGGSKTTLASSAFFYKLGIRGSLGRSLWTPWGPASSWETFLGRWTAPAGGGAILYDWWNNNGEYENKP